MTNSRETSSGRCAAPALPHDRSGSSRSDRGEPASAGRYPAGPLPLSSPRPKSVHRSAFVALLLALALLGSCRRGENRPGGVASRGRFFVLAASAPILAEAGDEPAGSLDFGAEIRDAREERGWVRFRREGREVRLSRALVESEEERRVREQETAKILSLVPHAAVLLREVGANWTPSGDSVVLTRLPKGARIRVYTAYGDWYAFELVDPNASSRRYVGYVPIDSVAWEAGEALVPGEPPTRVVTDVKVLEHGAGASGGEDPSGDEIDSVVPAEPSPGVSVEREPA